VEWLFDVEFVDVIGLVEIVFCFGFVDVIVDFVLFGNMLCINGLCLLE